MTLPDAMLTPTELSLVLERTEQALALQGCVPSSPGAEIDGRPVLCAGAMLVREAIAWRGCEAQAAAFEIEVVQRDRAFICAAGEKVGLDPEVVRRRIIENDAAAPAHRLVAMLAQIRELQHVSDDL
jgi:hypothetical protein